MANSANSGDEAVNGVDEKTQDKRQKKHDKEAADLERVTDFMEENEIKSMNITNAAQMFVDKGNRQAEEKLAKEVELQKIQIKKADIELIMYECEVSFSLAEKSLRENKGDVVDALVYLLR